MIKGGKWYKCILYIAISLALIGFLASLWLRTRAADSVQKSIVDNCPLISEAVRDGNYDNGILFHGIFLIDIHAISDERLKKALETAKKSGQINMYYSSELSAGNWYEIDDYSRLDSITPLGESISIEEVEKNCPYVRYYIDKNGLVHDLTKDGKPITSLYNEPDPYNKYLLEDFSDLLKYVEGDEISSDVADSLTDFYDSWPKDDYTDRRDLFLDNAQLVKKALVDTGDPQDDDLTQMMELAEKVADADRRYHYYGNIEDIPLYLKKDNIFDGKLYSANAAYPGAFAFLDDMRSSTRLNEREYGLVTDTKGNVALNKSNYEKDMIADPGQEGTLLDQEYYKAYMALLDSVVENPNDMDTVKPLLKRFCFLYNIKNEIVSYPLEEIKIIDELMPRITEKYVEALSAGADPNYNTALLQGDNTASLEGILYSQVDAVDLVRFELQFMISARLLRMEDEDAKEDYILDRINISLDFYYKVVKDAFLDYANTSIALHIEWLKAMLRTIDTESFVSEDEIAEVTAAVEALEKYEDAVENGNINEINRLIEIINYYGGVDEIEKSETELYQKDTGENKLDKILEEIKGRAKSDLEEGNAQSGALFTLVVLNDQESLEEIEDEFSGLDVYKEGMEIAGRQLSKEARAEFFSDLVAEAKEHLGQFSDGNDGNVFEGENSDEQGQNTDGDDIREADISDEKTKGLGTDLTEALSELTDADKNKTISEDMIAEAIEDVLDNNGSFDAKGKIIAAVATGELGDAGFSKAREISKRLMLQCVAENNKYAYKTAIVNDMEFVSLKTIDRISDFRYAYDDSKNRITMENVGAGNAFVYALGSDRVQIYDGKTESLDIAPLKTDGFVYVVESDCKKRYGIVAMPVTDTGYSGAFTEEMTSKKEALVKKLVEEIKSL